MIESSNGAKASATLYSLVETAKANMINTFEYFNLLLTEIPQHMDDKDFKFIDDLLPWSPRVQKECPSRYKKSWFLNVHIYFYKVCSISAKMRGFLLSSTHVWGFTSQRICHALINIKIIGFCHLITPQLSIQKSQIFILNWYCLQVTGNTGKIVNSHLSHLW